MLLPPISENDELAALCESLGVRYVRVGSALLDDARHCVSSNDREVVAEAVRKLIALGHRRIGFVRGPAGFRSAAEREKGFHEALEEAGLSLADDHYAPGNSRRSKEHTSELQSPMRISYAGFSLQQTQTP